MFAQGTYTSGVDCVVNTPKIFGSMGDGSLNGFLDTDIDLDGISLKVWRLSKRLSLGNRLPSSLQVDVSHD